MLKHYFRILSVVLAAVLVLSACKKDDDGGMSSPPPPETFLSLLDAYNHGVCYLDAVPGTASTRINFTDGTDLTIQHSDFPVYDLSAGSLPTIRQHATRHVWVIGTKVTDIPVVTTEDINQTLPVLAGFDSERFSLMLSNGTTIYFENRADKALSLFVFKKALNTELSSDLSCIMMGQKVKGVFPEGMTDYELIPTFEFRGKRLMVDGIEQESGVTAQDFSRPVEYTLEALDGTMLTYTVDIERALRFPTVYITTDGGAPILDKKNYVSGTIRIEDPDCRYSNTPKYESRMGIRGRGNSTWGMPKKPWKVKLDNKMRIFDISNDKEWALLANYADKTLIRNIVAMEISRICDMKWTPAMYSVDVYLNDQYQGCYTWTEHKKVSEERVNLNIVGPGDNDGEAVTGDYYLEIEQQMDETTCFWTDNGVPMMFSEPEVPTGQQWAYVTGYFRDFEAALFGPNFADPENGYAKYIDVPSFINYYIIQELTKNIDGNIRKSSFLTKERGQKLEMYHVWDFDLTLGNCDYFPNMYPGTTNTYEGWFIKNCSLAGVDCGWFWRLFQDPAFVRQVKQRWNSVKAQLRAVPDFIDMNAQLIDGAQKRNFQKWTILNQYVWPNQWVLGDYTLEVKAMKQFYEQRLEWLDNAINKL